MATFSNLKLKLAFLGVCLLLFGGGVLSYGKDVAPSSAQAEQAGKTVTISVYDNEGPVIGASVIVKDTTIGDISDLDGNVVLNNIPDDAVLVVSFIGYITQEIEVKNRGKINVTLQEDVVALSEAVSVGYGSLDKKMVTSSITSVKGDDLMVGVGGSDITTALQGKIPGLVMYNEGSVNAESTIQLRGLTSITAGSSPLIVIDGYTGGDIRSLNVDDIQSIDVLKDASAGAIYGTRAASGVIMITTKSGYNTEGKLRLTYSNELSHRDDYGRLDLLSGREYAEYGIGTDYGSDTDWWDELINHNNFSHKHTVTIDYGTEKANVYATFFYSNTQGIAKQDEREDYGGKFTANFTFFDGWLELRPYVEYRQTLRNNHRANFRQAVRNNPTRSPYDENSETGYNVWVGESYDYNVLADAMLEQYKGLDKWFLPQITAKLNIKPVKGLSYQQNVSYENRQWELQEYWPSTHRSMVESNINGEAYIDFSKTEFTSLEGYFTYDNLIKGKHSINAVLGYSYFERNGETYDMYNYDFTVDNNTIWDIGEGSYLSTGKADMSSNKSITQRLMSYYARFNYAYDEKYIGSASIRYEGSSKFGRDNRWATFWAFSVAWRLSKENFLKNVSWLEDLKVRFGYGVTGNNDFSASYTADLLSSDTKFLLPDGSWAYSYGKANNVNDNLGWEKKYEWDVGVDFEFFKGRLYGKFDYYRRKISDMIYNVTVATPPYTQTTMYQNIGSMESKGFEIELGGDIIRSKSGFVWHSDLNLNHYTGKILDLTGDNSYYDSSWFPSPGDPGYAARIEEGSKIGSFHIWKWAGFTDDGEWLLYNKDGEIINAADKSDNDMQYIGNYIPDLIIGWNHTLSYKNFDFGLNLRSWIGHDVYNTFAMYHGIQTNENFNRLKSAYTKYAHIHAEKQLCSYYLEDGTFLKIDSITLGYTQPMARYTNGMIDRLRFYFTVGNLCTITGYSGFNPEVNIGSWDGGLDAFWQNFYPKVRTYTLGMKFNF